MSLLLNISKTNCNAHLESVAPLKEDVQEPILFDGAEYCGAGLFELFLPAKMSSAKGTLEFWE